MKPGKAALSASLARAVDLSGLKARAETPPAGPGAPAGDGQRRYVIDVTEATFEDEVLRRSLQLPVVLDLWAEWCGPCKQLGPVLEKLAGEGNGSWLLAKIDVDANPAIAQALRVQGIPAVKAVFQGQLVAEFTGAMPEPQVRQWINALVEAIGGAMSAGAGQAERVEPADPRMDAAEEALARNDLAEAARRFGEILAAEPAHESAAAALRQVELLRRAQHAPANAVAIAEATPHDVDAQLAAADVQLLADQVQQAFDRLLATVRRTAGEDRERARSRLVELFAVVGDADPRVGKARRELASVLF